MTVQSLVAAPSTAQRLLSELQHADTIIKAMLNTMTVQQKIKVGAQLEAAGIADEGMTRYHERRAAIDAANAAAPTRISRHLPSVKPVTSEPAPLTAKERDIVLAYRATDDEGQAHIAWSASYEAENYPRRAKPALQLVAGGVK
jgi:hypothetical protein